jgi:hypothetical protein
MDTKKYFTRLQISTLMIVLSFFSSCEKEFDYGKDQNAVKTLEATNILQTSVNISAEVIKDNGASLSARGICYGINNKPTTSGNLKADPSPSIGNFSCLLENLLPGTIYYVRAYATNSFGTAYGNEISFTTKEATIPILSTTTTATMIAPNSAQSGGVIINSGASTVTRRGVCYSSTATVPTIADSTTNNGTGIGTFISAIVNLLPNTRYYARAFATNSIGTGYANNVISFVTSAATAPTGITTNALSSITQITATGGGGITNSGGSPVTSRGVCWSSVSTSPTISNSRTQDGTGIGNFTSALTGLSANTTYYVRAYATNVVGTTYGAMVQFTTASATIPTNITTNAISSITLTTAAGGGNVVGDGGAAITAKGVCWSNSTSSPTIANSRTTNGSGVGSFTSALTGLIPGTIYYVRAYATNAMGTNYGAMVQFTTTAATIPTNITTNALSSITMTTAAGGGNVVGDGGAAITAKGVCWSNSTTSPTIANSRTTDGSGVGSFTSALTGLMPGTTYYVRAYATNSVGTVYGNVRSFVTIPPTAPVGITTTAISAILQNSASSGGTIGSDGGAAITSKGVCWSNLTSAPTIADSRSVNGTGSGAFISPIAGLFANTTYYLRAYATNSVGTTYGNTFSFTTLANLAVGQAYQGGIIGYIFVPGDAGYVAGQVHGLITTTSHQSTGSAWGCSGTSITTGNTIGSGQTNTFNIVNGCATSNIAARICDNLTSGGYNDWFLPSSTELSRLYTNRLTIGGFLNTQYWSSSQVTTTSATSVNFSSGGTFTTSSKNNLFYVRAVRRF